MPDRTCNLCGSRIFEPLELGEPVARTGHNVLCERCGLIFHHPVMTAEEMHAFYAAEYSGEYSASEAISRDLARQRLRVISRWVDPVQAGPVLEIGCAQGEFLSEISALGVEARGVEPSQVMSSHGRNAYGLDIRTGIYDDLPETVGGYGLICLFHVLEHMADPLATLQRIRRELRPEGLLFLEVPTLGDCQLALVFKNIHPFTFVRETLEALLSLTGFTPELVEERGYHLRVVASPSEPRAQRSLPDGAAVSRRVQEYLATRLQIVTGIREKLAGLAGRCGGAIYGAGLNTLDLNQVFPLTELSLTAAFDADPKKQGKTILGLPIHAPEALRHWQGPYVIISSYAFQEEIRAQLHFLEQRGVELIPLYDKGTS